MQYARLSITGRLSPWIFLQTRSDSLSLASTLLYLSSGKFYWKIHHKGHLEDVHMVCIICFPLEDIRNGPNFNPHQSEPHSLVNPIRLINIRHAQHGTQKLRIELECTGCIIEVWVPSNPVRTIVMSTRANDDTGECGSQQVSNWAMYALDVPTLKT